jgi:serine protease AprX
MKHFAKPVWTAFAALGMLSVPNTSFAQHNHKFAPDVDRIDPSNAVTVIVQYKQDPTNAEEQQISGMKGSIKARLHSLTALSISIKKGSLQQLADDPNVEHVSMDHVVGARGAGAKLPVAIVTPDPPATSSVAPISSVAEYTTEPINAPQVWSQKFDGTGIGVAVIDSGITPVDDLMVAGKNKALLSRIVYSQSFVPTELGITFDLYGHGTHVAGLIAGNGTDSTGKTYSRTFSGVAPNANLINLRVLDENGQGSDSSVINAIETAIALQSTYNIRVINLSLGRPIYESYTLDPLCQEVEKAWKAGIVVVVAAGNDGRDLALNAEGYGTIEAPGNDPYALTVGAVRTMGTAQINDDAMASYSSKGPSFIDHIAKPDLVAPGNLVSSLLAPIDNLAANNPSFVTLNSFYITKGNNDPSTTYFPLSGTSMATGVASGAAALLLQAQPNLSPDQLKALVMSSANRSYLPQSSYVTDPDSGVTYTAHNDLLTIGAGELDVFAALTNAQRAGGSLPSGGYALSPGVAFDPSSGNAYLVTDSTALWGRTALWGASDIYGQSAFTGQVASSTALWGADNPSGFTALWGRTALWGADDDAGMTALWGRTALWGASTPEAATALWGSSDVAGSTALWGASTLGGSTALWGASIPTDR